MGLLSRKYRLISPMIIGTAYVEKRTLCFKSKLSIDFMSPIQPTWNRSSAFSPRLLNRLMTLKTNRKLPLMSFSRASWTFSFLSICLNNSFISSFFKTGNFDVSTPQMSTLFLIKLTPPVMSLVRCHYVRKGFVLCAKKFPQIGMDEGRSSHLPLWVKPFFGILFAIV